MEKNKIYPNIYSEVMENTYNRNSKKSEGKRTKFQKNFVSLHCKQNKKTTIMDTKLPIYHGLASLNYKLVTLKEMLDLIKSDETLRMLTDRVRKGQKEYKMQLPYTMLSAIVTNGLSKNKDNIVKHTGLLQIDIDKVKDVKGIKRLLAQDEYVISAFISPSGNGVKGIVAYDTEKINHVDAFLTFEYYFKNKYKIEIDKACKNINRLMFLSYDPEIVVKDTYKVLDTIHKEVKAKKQKRIKNIQTITISGDTTVKNIDKALRTIESTLISTPKGERHNTLLKYSSLVGAFVKKNYISFTEAEMFLERCATYMFGNEYKKEVKTYQDGLQFGYDNFELNDSIQINTVKTIEKIDEKVKQKDALYNILRLHYDKEIRVNEKLSEKAPEVIRIVKDKKRVLITAPTGVGKTYALINNIIPELTGKTLILVPLRTLARQIADEYNIPMFIGGQFNLKAISEHNTAVATYDTGTFIMQHYNNIVVDEAHNLISAYGFRKRAIDGVISQLDDKDTVIFTTATSTNLLKYHFELYGINVIVKNDTKENVNVFISNKKPLRTVEVILKKWNRDKKLVIKVKDRNELNAIKDLLLDKYELNDKDIMLITSNIENEKDNYAKYWEIVNTRLIPENVKVILTTNYINDGINILNDDIDIVVSYESVYNSDINEFKQFIARFRKKDNIKYYMVLPFTSKSRDLKEELVIYSQTNLTASEMVDSINRISAISGKDVVDVLNTHRYIRKENDNYVLNDMQIVYDSYTQYINSFNYETTIFYLKHIFGLNVNYDNMFELIKVRDNNENAKYRQNSKDNRDKYLYNLIKDDTDLQNLAYYSYYEPVYEVKRVLNEYDELVKFQENKEYKGFEEIYITDIAKLVKRYFQLKQEDLTHDEIIELLFDTEKEKLRGAVNFKEVMFKFKFNRLLNKDKLSKVEEWTLDQIKMFIYKINSKTKWTNDEIDEVIKEVFKLKELQYFSGRNATKMVELLFNIERKREGRAKTTYIYIKSKKYRLMMMKQLEIDFSVTA